MSKKTENITDISLEELLPFQEHPFLVRDDEQMAMIVESIKNMIILLRKHIDMASECMYNDYADTMSI